MLDASQQRILTTHTGSLPRPPDLAERMLEYSNGTEKDPPGLWEQVASATRDVVKRQVDLGLDIVSDGEFGKASYAGYVKERLTGFDGEPRRTFGGMREQAEFPDWVRSSTPRVTFPSNNGPVSLRDRAAVRCEMSTRPSSKLDSSCRSIVRIWRCPATRGSSTAVMPSSATSRACTSPS